MRHSPWKIVKMFEETVADYCGSKFAVATDNCTDALDLCRQYLIDEKTIPKTSEILTTLSCRGARWRGVEYPTEKIDIFDVSGAGDAFLVAFSIFHHLTQNVPSAIGFANKCARAVVQLSGTCPISRQHLGVE